MEKIFCQKCGKETLQCPCCKVYYCIKCEATYKKGFIGKLIDNIRKK